MLFALIVDDHVALRSAVARHFERRGWQVVSAANGLQGLDAVRRRSFDVVISDVNMRERGGVWWWENALALRPELRGRFILISSEPLPEPRVMPDFESEHVLLKPLSLTTLCDAVQRVVQTAEETRSEQQSAWVGHGTLHRTVDHRESRRSHLGDQ